jgi:hypothetical protein
MNLSPVFQMRDVTGQPRICPQSQSMLRQARSFEERLTAYQARARHKAQLLKEEIEKRRAAEEAEHAHPPRITPLSRKLARGVAHLVGAQATLPSLNLLCLARSCRETATSEGSTYM